jgi:hypothetical protein
MERVKEKGWGCRIASGLAILLLAAAPAFAFEDGGTLGDVSYQVIAPDWCWAHDSFNVLVFLDIGENGADVRLTLRLPPRVFESADEGSPRQLELSVSGAGRHRVAFRNIRATEIGSDAGSFELRIAPYDSAGPELISESMFFGIESIRGPVVQGDGWWSIGVQVSVAALALPAFALFLRRYSKRGAWKRVVDPVIPDSEERWWSETS